MAKPVTSKKQKESALSYHAEIKEFMTPEVIKLFTYVVAESVRRGRLKSGAVEVIEKAPWLVVKTAVNLNNLFGYFETYTRFKLIDVIEDGKAVTKGLPAEPYLEKKEALLIEKCIWQVVVLCLILERGISEKKYEGISCQISFLFGYLHGVHHMNEYGERGKVRAVWDRTVADVLTKAREVRLAPIRAEKDEFNKWAAARLKAGDNPSTLDGVMSLSGFKPKWSQINEKTLRSMARAAGFPLRPGRPAKI